MTPLSAVVSKLFANPLVPYKPAAIALGNVFVEVTFPFTPFLTEPEFKVPVTPASTASVQPSPSESKSNLFGIPSLSVSRSASPQIALNSPKNILYAAFTAIPSVDI